MRLWFSLMALSLSFSANAAELSLLSGLYKQEKNKVAGEKAGGKSEIEVGGRFSDAYDVGMDWFGQSSLIMRNYDAPSGVKSPSDGTSLVLGGGLRMYFDNMTQGIAPFAYGMASYISDKSAEYVTTDAGGGYEETEISGLFYSMHVGVRFGFDQNVFLDLEAPLFVSALNATTTVETTVGEASSKNETTQTELYFDSESPLSEFKFVLGMKI